jgi:hypothetical protein
MFRKVLISLLVLLVALVVVADRVGASVASHVLASKLQSDEHLQSRPDVSIEGVPFLTQVFSGKYHQVNVTAHNYRTQDGVVVQTLNVKLHGVHIPFSKILHGSVSRVPVDHVDGSAFVSFPEMVRYLAGKGVSVTITQASAEAVTVVRTATVGGQQVRARGTATISAAGGGIAIDVHPVLIQGSAYISAAVARRIQSYVVVIPLRSLPFRFTVTSVAVSAGGVTGAGFANHVVLGS